jgi:hypothetical protein
MRVPTVGIRPDNIAAIRNNAASIAGQLYKLGLFVGTGVDKSNYPVFELERPLKRIEALTIVIRLFGLEETAKTMEGPFYKAVIALAGLFLR